MTYQRCQEETTSTQFLDWMEYLEQDVNAFHREDWFLSNIAREIRLAFAKETKKVPKLESFIIKFKEVKKKIITKKITKKERAARMKAHFLGWAGIKKGK